MINSGIYKVPYSPSRISKQFGKLFKSGGKKERKRGKKDEKEEKRRGKRR